MDTRLCRVRRVGEILLLPDKAVYEAIATGAIPEHLVVRIGKRIRVNETGLLAWLSGGEANGKRKAAEDAEDA